MSENGKALLRTRTKQYALRILRLYSWLFKKAEAQVLGKQLLRSGTSIGTHYREVSRARSSAEFISKIQLAIQELDVLVASAKTVKSRL